MYIVLPLLITPVHTCTHYGGPGGQVSTRNCKTKKNNGGNAQIIMLKFDWTEHNHFLYIDSALHSLN